MLVTRATAFSRSKRLEQLHEAQHASAISRHHAARRAATAAAAKPTEAITEFVRQLQGKEHQQQTEGQTAITETKLLWREVQPDGRAMASTSLDIKGQLKTLFLPEGYPASVSPDYLQYQLWALPTHVTVSLLPAQCHACTLHWALELRF